jgi:hypothetical protein
MARRTVVPACVVVAVAALLSPAADAKLNVSIALEPAQPVAQRPVRVRTRTEIVLPRSERLSLIGVGPWRTQSGQGVLDVELGRIGPRTFSARLRIPYPGRWRLQVVSAAGAILAGRQVTVR